MSISEKLDKAYCLFQIVMSISLLTFLVIFCCGFLGQHEAGADCGASTSGVWKDDDADVEDGTCSRSALNKDSDNLSEHLEDDSYQKESTIDSSETGIQENPFSVFIKFFKFVWQVLSIWINWK
ncbi:uncharacterized protein LOC108113565 [Drosophila eugracilis]|uniref:uncharacterized protein LOC108113565 n=1 Tax=Drosophila eugracilis TaxID=29029 RepID=UPI0007E6D8BB|nr:uncharacterized protein LOC108113565 [Drosophila eugracilis]